MSESGIEKGNSDLEKLDFQNEKERDIPTILKTRADYELLEAEVKRLERQFAEAVSRARGAPGVAGSPFASAPNPAPGFEREIKRYEETLDQYRAEHPEEFEE